MCRLTYRFLFWLPLGRGIILKFRDNYKLILMKLLEVTFVGISMCVGIVHIFGADVITYHFAIIAFSVSGLIEIYRNFKTK